MMDSVHRTLNTEHRTKFIDTHCHLDFPEFDADRDEVIRRAREQGIEHHPFCSLALCTGWMIRAGEDDIELTSFEIA